MQSQAAHVRKERREIAYSRNLKKKKKKTIRGWKTLFLPYISSLSLFDESGARLLVHSLQLLPTPVCKDFVEASWNKNKCATCLKWRDLHPEGTLVQAPASQSQEKGKTDSKTETKDNKATSPPHAKEETVRTKTLDIPVPVAVEGTKPIPTQGVQLFFLLQLSKVWQTVGIIKDTDRVEDVVEKIIKPQTLAGKTSFVDYLSHSDDGAMRAAVEKANKFVSHAWQYKYLDVMESLKRLIPSEGIQKKTYIWMDILAISQHEEHEPDHLMHVTRTNINSIGHTILMQENCSAPVPLQRAWCMFELFCTQEGKAKFDICMSSNEYKEFKTGVQDNFEAVVRSFSAANIEQAKASKEAEREKMLEHVNRTVGTDYFNKVVLYLLKKWLTMVARNMQKKLDVDKPDAKGVSLLYGLGTLLCALGKFDEAEVVLKQALKGREELLGPEHESTVMVQRDLARVLCVDQKLAEAEPLFRKVLESTEKILGKDHLQTLAAVSALAKVMDDQGKLPEAEVLYKRLLEGKEKLLGPENSSVVAIVNSLSMILKAQKKYEEAEPLYRRSLKAKEDALGPNHPSALTWVNNYALILKALGRLEEAETFYVRAMKGREEALGAKDPSTLTTVSNYAFLLKEMGRLKEAEALHRRAMKGREEVLGTNHPTTIASVNYVAEVLRAQGKDMEAERYFRRVVTLVNKSLGKDANSSLKAQGKP
eukprot:g17786.t1